MIQFESQCFKLVKYFIGVAMTARIRTTISVDEKTYEAFKIMASAANMSVSKCMGEWLSDTVEGAQFVTQKMLEAKSAPMKVLKEMKDMTFDLQSELDITLQKESKKQRDVPDFGGKRS